MNTKQFAEYKILTDAIKAGKNQNPDFDASDISQEVRAMNERIKTLDQRMDRAQKIEAKTREAKRELTKKKSKLDNIISATRPNGIVIGDVPEGYSLVARWGHVPDQNNAKVVGSPSPPPESKKPSPRLTIELIKIEPEGPDSFRVVRSKVCQIDCIRYKMADLSDDISYYKVECIRAHSQLKDYFDTLKFISFDEAYNSSLAKIKDFIAQLDLEMAGRTS